MNKLLVASVLLTGCSDYNLKNTQTSTAEPDVFPGVPDLCDISIVCGGEVDDVCHRFLNRIEQTVTHLVNYSGPAELELDYQDGGNWDVRVDGFDFYSDHSIHSRVETPEGYGCRGSNFFIDRPGGYRDRICSRIEFSSPEIDTLLEFCEADTIVQQGDAAFLYEEGNSVETVTGMNITTAINSTSALIMPVQDTFNEYGLDWQSSGVMEVTVDGF